MIGGMVKKNCSDPQDIGELCWPQSTQAYVLGSYFYGYTAQILAALIAKHLIGWFYLCHNFTAATAAAKIQPDNRVVLLFW